MESEQSTLGKLTMRDLDTLTSQEVAALLFCTGHAQYATLCMNVPITGKYLGLCNDSKLEEIGITHRPHRLSILALVEKLQSEGVPACLFESEWIEEPAWLAAAEEDLITAADPEDPEMTQSSGSIHSGHPAIEAGEEPDWLSAAHDELAHAEDERQRRPKPQEEPGWLAWALNELGDAEIGTGSSSNAEQEQRRAQVLKKRTEDLAEKRQGWEAVHKARAGAKDLEDAKRAMEDLDRALAKARLDVATARRQAAKMQAERDHAVRTAREQEVRAKRETSKAQAERDRALIQACNDAAAARKEAAEALAERDHAVITARKESVALRQEVAKAIAESERAVRSARDDAEAARREAAEAKHEAFEAREEARKIKQAAAKEAQAAMAEELATARADAASAARRAAAKAQHDRDRALAAGHGNSEEARRLVAKAQAERDRALVVAREHEDAMRREAAKARVEAAHAREDARKIKQAAALDAMRGALGEPAVAPIATMELPVAQAAPEGLAGRVNSMETDFRPRFSMSSWGSNKQVAVNTAQSVASDAHEAAEQRPMAVAEGAHATSARSTTGGMSSLAVSPWVGQPVGKDVMEKADSNAATEKPQPGSHILPPSGTGVWHWGWKWQHGLDADVPEPSPSEVRRSREGR
jgi:hypothetical protein